jgi:hypothetical protein
MNTNRSQKVNELLNLLKPPKKLGRVSIYIQRSPDDKAEFYKTVPVIPETKASIGVPDRESAEKLYKFLME